MSRSTPMEVILEPEPSFTNRLKMLKTLSRCTTDSSSKATCSKFEKIVSLTVTWEEDSLLEEVSLDVVDSVEDSVVEVDSQEVTQEGSEVDSPELEVSAPEVSELLEVSLQVLDSPLNLELFNHLLKSSSRTFPGQLQTKIL